MNFVRIETTLQEMVLFQPSDERSGDKLVVVNVSTLSPEDVNGSTCRNTVIFLLDTRQCAKPRNLVILRDV